jgi:hypothetical protein
MGQSGCNDPGRKWSGRQGRLSLILKGGGRGRLREGKFCLGVGVTVELRLELADGAYLRQRLISEIKSWFLERAAEYW